jgi:hypothetical protein
MKHIKLRSQIFLVLAYLFLSSALEAAECTIPKKGVTSIEPQVRLACIQAGHFSAQSGALSVTELLNGPPGKMRYPASSQIFCRFFAREQGGSSKKFRCYRTDDKNILFDELGTLRPDAVKVGAHDSPTEDILFGQDGRELLYPNGKVAKADVLKVRYSDGTERNRENFTSALAGHLAWILGFPAERFYPVQGVTCFGCARDPFLQSRMNPTEKHAFAYATLEKKYSGPRIFKEDERTRAWNWKEAVSTLLKSDEARQVEFEELVLFANFLHIVEERGSQHALVCDEAEYDKDTRVCKRPYLMIHDLGAAFGDRSLRTVTGSPNKSHPRGDYAAYKGVRMFASRERCQPVLKAGGYAKISERGRASFARRLELLTPELLKASIEAANFEHVDPALRSQLTQREKLEGAALNERARQLWQNLLTEKLEEIKTARCPN